LYARKFAGYWRITPGRGGTENDVFVVNVTFCLVASVLLTLVLVEAEIDASHGHLLAAAEIASGRPSVWTSPAQAAAASHLR
jgi:hypothetical protein